MRRVQQGHAAGCGPACLAMVGDISYKKALNIIHPDRKPYSTANTWPHKLEKGLRRAKIKFIKRIDIKPNQLKTLKFPAIVNIRWSGPDGRHHWVVWDPEKKKFLDPYYKNLYNKIYENGFKRTNYKTIYLIIK